MMKKILFYICTGLLLTSCYKDKGSYSYNFDDLNEIQNVTFTPASFSGIHGTTIELQQPLTEDETRRVSVNVEQSLMQNIDNLEFTWRRSYTKDKEAVKDTLYTPGYIDLWLPAGQDMSYDIMLEIKDKTTSLTRYSKFLVETRPIFKNSLFILHGNTPGNYKLGNVEIIGNSAEVRPDAYKTVYPGDANNPFSSCVGLGYNTYIEFNRTTGAIVESYNLCAFNQDGTGMAYNPYGLTTKFQPNYVLPTSSTPFILDRIVANGDNTGDTYFQCILSRDGRFYVGRQYMCFGIPGSASYDPLHTKDYTVKAAAITEFHYVLWDEKNSRFIYTSKYNSFGSSESQARMYAGWLQNPVLDAGVDFSNLSEDLRPTGKQAVYGFTQCQNGTFSNPFFLFKNKDNSNYYMYELTPTDTGKDKTAKSIESNTDETVEQAYTITGKRLKGFNPGSNISSITYNSWFSTNYLFYADGGYVYRYDTSNGDLVPMYSAPEGYTVSVIKFRTTDSSMLFDNLGRYLSIGMNKSTEGAVAEILLTTAGDVDETVEPTFYTGFGNIKALQFAPVYYYKSLSTE